MNLYILGAGGHGKVLADVALDSYKFENIYFLDDNKKVGSKVMNISVINCIDYKYIASLNTKENYFIVAFGNNIQRRNTQKILEELDVNIISLIHSKTSISKFSSIGKGSVICAGAILGPNTSVGEGSIINHSATIDHDCKLGDFIHICPNSSLAGNVKVDSLTILGIGTKVIENITIGKECVIGAASLIIKDIPHSKKAFGVPAKIIK